MLPLGSFFFYRCRFSSLMRAYYRKNILDISNICPIPIFGTQQYSRNDAFIIQKAAQQRYDERMEKFNAISTANGIKFHPIIFETTGRVHTESFRFLQSILRN